MPSKPSFDLKLDRAEKHLVELEAGIAAYVATNPYAIAMTRDHKGQPQFRLVFTSQPSDELAMVAADFIYNVRSALDHLTAALVPRKDRDSVMFPVFFQGVWNDAIEGENEQRLKERQRWITVTRNMHSDAVALLKRAQPDESGRNDETLHGLAALNRISNRDRHSKLPVIASALRDPYAQCKTAGGENLHTAPFKTQHALPDGAPLHKIPADAVEVKVTGTPVVMIRIGQTDGGYVLPDAFRENLLRASRSLVEALRPYVR